jgi:hypothetical protein
MIINVMILIACAGVGLAFIKFWSSNQLFPVKFDSLPTFLLVLALSLAVLLVVPLVFVLSVLHFNVYHAIIEHLRVGNAVKSGINTAKTYFRVTFKLYMVVFLLQALLGITKSCYTAALLSMIMQLCIISITIDSVQKRHVK